MLNKSERPVIKIELTTADKMAEVIGVLVLVTFWAVTLFYYSKLPDTIPTHYNISGQADDHGSKTTILLLPVVGTILFLALHLTTLNHTHPSIHWQQGLRYDEQFVIQN